MASVQERPSSSASKAYLRIFSYLGLTEAAFACVAVTAAIGSGTGLALVNLVMGRLIQSILAFTAGASSPNELMQVVKQYCQYLVYIGLARWACVYIYSVVSTYVAYRVVRNIRRDFFRSALSQNIEFFDKNTNSVSMQATTNGSLIQSGVSEKLMAVFQALATCVAAFIIAFIIQWKLTLILLFVAPLMFVLMGTVASLESKIETEQLDLFAQAGTFTEHVLATIRTVHAFGIRPRLVADFDVYIDKAKQLGMKKGPLYGFLFSLEYFIVYSATGLAFWQGIKMIANGEVDDLGTVFTYSVIMSVVVASMTITVVAPYVVSFQRAGTAAAQLFTIIDRTSGTNPFEETKMDSPKQNDVSELKLNDVTFNYPSRPGLKVLDRFSLRVPSRKVTALVGASGSGKSTIIGLIERWYRPTSGEITLDGISVEEFNLTWLRTHIRLVQQEPVLFSGTVFANIAHGLVGTQWEDAPLAEQQQRVEWAARVAFAHDFITELPESYSTQIGQRGSLLSGGQKQRIAIARSIISDPQVLLLDEPTSALDSHAARIVQKALDNVSRDRTTLIIAHNLSTIKHADNIVVVGKGSVIEQGTHESLVAADGVYARMVEAQTLIVGGKGQRENFERLRPQSEYEGEKGVEGEDAVKGIVADTEHGRPAPLGDHYDYAKASRKNLFVEVCYILRENWELRWCFLALAAGCSLGAVALPGQAILMAYIMKIFNLPSDEMQSRGSFYSLMYFVMGLAALVIFFLNGWIANYAAQEMNRKFRRNLFDNVLCQDIQFFDLPENTIGALTARLDSTAQSMIELMSINIVLILLSSLTVLACSILSIATSWKLGLVCVFSGLGPVVAAGITRIYLELRMADASERRFADSAAIASEAILAIRTVCSLAIERTVLNKYTKELDEGISRCIYPLLHTMIWFSLTQTVEQFVLSLGFWWGCSLLGDGHISLYQFFISFLGVYFAGQNAGTIFTYTNSITKGKSAADYYLWLRALKPTIQDTTQNKTIVPQHGVKSLHLDGVTFRYPLRPSISVLQDVDMTAKTGQFIAVVGPSGCGKSSVVALLERFYDPTSGTIRIDEQPLADMSPGAYRSHVAWVPQEAALYPNSIQQNVLLGLGSNPGPDEGQVEASLRAANAWDFVSSLPDGVHTLCGTNGSHLSGGQKQRIAIARALIRRPKLLLLDEATSALDTASESIVQQSLHYESSRRDTVTLAVAHRLSTIKHADCIYVFDGGRIVEKGTHDDLVAQDGIYKKLCDVQSLDAGTGL